MVNFPMSDNLKQGTKAIEYVTMLIVLINLAVTTIGGYFYIGRYEAKLFQSETNLAEIRKDIAALELKFAEEKRKYETLSTKLNYSSDLIEFINNVQPRYEVKAKPQLKKDGGRVSVYYDIKNIGKYDIYTKILKYSLFKIDGYPSQKKEIPIRIISLGLDTDIEPASTQTKDISFHMHANTKGSYYFEVVVEAEVDKKIKELTIELMKQYNHELHDGYFRKKYTGTGRFTIK